MAVTDEELIQRVKDCGDSLIENAEKIAGNYRQQTGLDISIHIPMYGIPEVEINQEYIPENYLKRNSLIVKDK